MVYEEKQLPAPPSATGEIEGLPETLPSGTVATLFESGKALALGIGERLTTYQLLLNSDRPTAGQRADYALPGHAYGIAESALGLLIAAECAGRSALLLLRDRELVTILELSGKITALAAAGAQAYVVVLEEDGRRGRLAQINVRQRAVVAGRPLDHAQMNLSVDPSGQHVVLADQVEHKVMSLGSDLMPESVAPALTRSEANPSAPPERETHDLYCCCLLCRPIGDGEPPSRPAPPGDEPPQPPAETRPPHDGDTGVPSDNGGTVVGNGDQVDHRPPPGSDRPPCGRSLFYPVADLQRLGAYFLASDRKACQVALLSSDMNLLEEWQFGRGGVKLLPAEGASTLVMHLRDSGKWVWHDVHEMVSKRRPDLDLFPLVPLESKTFIGQQTYALSHGQQPAPRAAR